LFTAGYWDAMMIQFVMPLSKPSMVNCGKERPT